MLKKIIASLSLATLLMTVSPIMGEAATYHNKAISTAKSHLGVKYKWGGTTPKGFDCSGLVNYSFKKSGKKMPRTAAELYKKGKKVKKLAKGDLMFYATSKGKKVTHVSIYIGDGKMIHASSSKGVSIAKTNNSYWKPKYLGAKRY